MFLFKCLSQREGTQFDFEYKSFIFFIFTVCFSVSIFIILVFAITPLSPTNESYFFIHHYGIVKIKLDNILFVGGQEKTKHIFFTISVIFLLLLWSQQTDQTDPWKVMYETLWTLCCVVNFAENGCKFQWNELITFNLLVLPTVFIFK